MADADGALDPHTGVSPPDAAGAQPRLGADALGLLHGDGWQPQAPFPDHAAGPSRVSILRRLGACASRSPR